MAKPKRPKGDRPKGLRTVSGLKLLTVESLKVLISLSGMTQRELAQASGMTESQVSEYLSGETAIGPVAIAKFSIGLKVSPDILATAENLSLEDVRKRVIDQLKAKAKGLEVDPIEDDADPAGDPAFADPKPANVTPITESPTAEESDEYDLPRNVRFLPTLAKRPNSEPIPLYSERAAASDVERPDDAHREGEVYADSATDTGASVKAINLTGRSMHRRGFLPGDTVTCRMSSGRNTNGRVVIVSSHDKLMIGIRDGHWLRKFGDDIPEHADVEMTREDHVIAIVIGRYRPPAKK
jgi:transcriptional regulator with XRE-family HTH domain